MSYSQLARRYALCNQSFYRTLEENITLKYAISAVKAVFNKHIGRKCCKLATAVLRQGQIDNKDKEREGLR